MVEESGKRKADSGGDDKKLTNRQKRKKLNEKNKWPQHPKIQSMDQRARAYIRVAGFGTSKVQKESIDPKLDLMSPEVKFGRLLGGTDQRKRHAAVNKLKAYLRARCDINNEGGGISELDLLKLWKGLWYTLYMADKVPVQDELSKRLAELLWCVAGTEEEDEYAGQAYMDICEAADAELARQYDDEDVTLEEIENTLREEVGSEEDSDDDEEDEQESDGADEDEGEEDDDDGEEEENSEQDENDPTYPEEMNDEENEMDDSEIPHCRGAHLASLFVRTFFRTIRREWGNMDKYRVDKFYTLTRLYLGEVFKYMATRHWNLGIIRLFNDAIFEEVLNQTPNGLRYHLIDITLEELAKANAKAPMPLTEATFLDTLEPYFAMSQTGAGDETIQARVLERVVEKFLDEYSVVSENALKEDDSGQEDEDEEDNLVFDQVHVGSVAQFIFELASDPETKDRYRKPLYDMHKKYARRLKAVGTDVELDEGANDLDGEEGYEDDVGDENEMETTEEKGCGCCPEKEEPAAACTKSKSKKKKKKSDDGKSPEDSTKITLNDSGKKKEKEAKKKKKRKAEKENTPTDDDLEEETLTISLSEQKLAKAGGKKKKKESKKAETSVSKNKSKEELSPGKRVQFTKVNRSKSHKASMKALVTSTPPKTSTRTPEKSILLNKGSPIIKAGRKRAVNYF